MRVTSNPATSLLPAEKADLAVQAHRCRRGRVVARGVLTPQRYSRAARATLDTRSTLSRTGDNLRNPIAGDANIDDFTLPK